MAEHEASVHRENGKQETYSVATLKILHQQDRQAGVMKTREKKVPLILNSLERFRDLNNVHYHIHRKVL